MLSRVERFGFWRTIVAYLVGSLALAAGLALMVRTFLFHPFSLPAASMAPTLLPGDHVFASKYPYGYTRYSLPFSPPLFSGRIFGSVPARGDVIVFRLPKDVSTDYVKRVVGLPGDRIQMKERRASSSTARPSSASAWRVSKRATRAEADRPR